MQLIHEIWVGRFRRNRRPLAKPQARLQGPLGERSLPVTRRTAVWKHALIPICGLLIPAAVCLAAVPRVVPVPSWEIIREERLPPPAQIEQWAAAKPAIFAAPGQIESLSFLVLPAAPDGIRGLKAQAGDLAGPGGIIPASALDLYLVRNWYTVRPKGTPPPTDTIPELLLHNPGIVAADRAGRTNVYGFRNLPVESATLRPFDIPAGMNAQLWVNVHVPDNASAGRYRGAITLLTPEPVRVPLEIEVLDIRLLRSAKDTLLYMPTWEDDVSYGLMLSDIKAHGVNAVTVYGGRVNWEKRDFSRLAHVLDMVRKAGLMDRLCVVLVDGLTFPPEDLKLADERSVQLRDFFAGYAPGVEFYLMVSDEPSFERFKREEPGYRVYQKNGLRTFTASPPGYAKGGDAITMPNIATKTWTPYPALECEIAQVHQMDRRIVHYGYSPARRQPELWRYKVGFWLFGSRFDGVAFWTYMVEPGTNAWNAEQRWGGGGHFALPATNAMIPTLHWEAYRSGADDGRYITTLAAQVMRAGTAGVADPLLADAARLLEESDEMFDPAKLAEIPWTGQKAPPIDGIKVQEFRRKVADLILAIQKAHPELHSRKLAESATLPEEIRKWRIAAEPKLGTPPFAAGEFPKLHAALKSALAAATHIAAEVKANPDRFTHKDTLDDTISESADPRAFEKDLKARLEAAIAKAAKPPLEAADALDAYLNGFAKGRELTEIQRIYLRQTCESDIAAARAWLKTHLSGVTEGRKLKLPVLNE